MDYFPNNYTSKLNLIAELNETLEDLSRTDFSSYADADVEGSDYIVGNIEKVVSKSASSALENAVELKAELIADILSDFSEKLKLYSFLVQRGFEDEDVFPFIEWGNTFKKIKEPIYINYRDVFIELDYMLAKNRELGILNFASFLESQRQNNGLDKNTWQLLENICTKHFSRIEMVDILCGTSKAEFASALQGNTKTPTEESKLFFKYAAYRPDEYWTFKTSNQEGMGVSISTSDFNEIFEHFRTTTLWDRISASSSSKKAFVGELLWSEDREKNQFYTVKRTGYFGSKIYKPVDVKWDNCKAFFHQIIRGDIEMAEYFVEKLSGLYGPEAIKKMSQDLSQLISISMQHKLESELGNNSSKPQRIVKV